MNKNTELERIKNLIENDRLDNHDAFLEVIINDLKNLLSDYFDLENTPLLSINKENGKNKITIECNAIRIKDFKVIPK